MGAGEEAQITYAAVSSGGYGVDGTDAAADHDGGSGASEGDVGKAGAFGSTLAVDANDDDIVNQITCKDAPPPVVIPATHSDSAIAPWPRGSQTDDPRRDPDGTFNPPLPATCPSPPSRSSTNLVPDSKPSPVGLCPPVFVKGICCPLINPCGQPAVPTQVHVVQWTSAYGRDAWAGGLWNCCMHAGDGVSGPCLCCLTCWCPCAIFGRTMEKAGWGSCGPSAILYLLSTCGTSLLLLVVVVCMASGLLRLLLFLASLLLLVLGMGLFGGYYRSALRKKLGFDGSEYLDRLIHAFCFWCALCQEYRTLSPPGPKRPRRLGSGSYRTPGAAPGVPIVLPPPSDVGMV